VRLTSSSGEAFTPLHASKAIAVMTAKSPGPERVECLTGQRDIEEKIIIQNRS
jgi:hypothetical protein